MAALAMTALACSSPSSAQPPPSVAPDGATSTLPTPASTTSAPVDDPAEPAASLDPEIVAFIAAMEEALVGTKYAGSALEAPEVYVATGRLFCEELSAGHNASQLIDEYVLALTGRPMDEAATGDRRLAHGLAEAGVTHLCPEQP